MAEKVRVLVAGATGYLGGYVVRELHSKGYWVRALARDPEKISSIRNSVDDCFAGEATMSGSIEGVCDGIDVVVSSLGIRSFKPSPGFEDVDYGANMNLLADAKANGVKHFIFVSAFKADEIREFNSMLACRERVADAIKDSGLRYTIARPNGFFNDMAGMFDMAAGGTFWIIGDGYCRINPIHGADLAEQLVNSIADEARWNCEFAVGGPETYSFRQIGELAFQELGKEPKLGYVPAWILNFASVVIKPLNKNASGILKAMSILGAESDMVAPASGTHSLRGFYKKLAAECKEKNKPSDRV